MGYTDKVNNNNKTTVRFISNKMYEAVYELKDARIVSSSILVSESEITKLLSKLETCTINTMSLSYKIWELTRVTHETYNKLLANCMKFSTFILDEQLYGCLYDDSYYKGLIPWFDMDFLGENEQKEIYKLLLENNKRVYNLFRSDDGKKKDIFDKYGIPYDTDFSSNEDCKVFSNMSADDFFSFFGDLQSLNNKKYTYGTDQGTFKHGGDVTDYLINQMGFNKKDAAYVMQLVDDIGACTYAAACNSILYEFRDKPEEYNRIFGFSLYDDKDDLPNISSDTLLADMYVTMNTGEYNPMTDKSMGLFYKDFDGNYQVNDGEWWDGSRVQIDDEDKAHQRDRMWGQCYMSGGTRFSGYNKLNDYLATKTNEVKVNSSSVPVFIENDKEKMVEGVQNAIADGKQVIIGATKYTLTRGNYVYDEGGSHAMYVTGVSEDGTIWVDSWAEKYDLEVSANIIDTYTVTEIEFVWNNN